MKSNYDEERMKAGKQLTLYESEVHVKAKQAEAESVVKQNIVDQKVCLILDQSSDIIGRPIVNTLISFYNSSTKNKCVLLIDTSLMKSCNSTTH